MEQVYRSVLVADLSITDSRINPPPTLGLHTGALQSDA